MKEVKQEPVQEENEGLRQVGDSLLLQPLGTKWSLRSRPRQGLREQRPGRPMLLVLF